MLKKKYSFWLVLLVLVSLCAIAIAAGQKSNTTTDIQQSGLAQVKSGVRTEKAPFETRRDDLLQGVKTGRPWELAQVQVKNVEPPEKASVAVVFSKTDLRRVIIISSSGEWVSDAKEVEIKLNVADNKRPKLICTMYKGSFKPSNPELKEWEVDKIMIADDKEFQDVVDSLNDGKLPTFK